MGFIYLKMYLEMMYLSHTVKGTSYRKSSKMRNQTNFPIFSSKHLYLFVLLPTRETI